MGKGEDNLTTQQIMARRKFERVLYQTTDRLLALENIDDILASHSKESDDYYWIVIACLKLYMGLVFEEEAPNEKVVKEFPPLISPKSINKSQTPKEQCIIDGFLDPDKTELPEVTKRCEYPACRRALTEKLRCSKCKAVYYCGAEHQRSHWKEHKATCKAV
eukprot:TRINITY_DN24980_c0_g1_i1.p1 TRINITY_DN24980_c0_g1~~TRINITY_DN24980_c0_g1_i1.p1  ORF type:complete len:162 (+),score=19.98 TRINITY_DN24980_c0_g1_i1:209-694(+)